VWIALLEASTVMDKDFEHVGCFLIYNNQTRSHPEQRLLRQLKVLMWYPWEQREIDNVADKCRRNVPLASFWVPTQEELDNATRHQSLRHHPSRRLNRLCRFG
jgi:hypothetical protein